MLPNCNQNKKRVALLQQLQYGQNTVARTPPLESQFISGQKIKNQQAGELF